MSLARQQRHFLVADYLSWPDELRRELIDGVIYDMVPAPSLDHQTTVRDLIIGLGEALRGRAGGDDDNGRCEMLPAPVDVVLNEETVVQPDLVVVCDPLKLTDRRFVQGAPDLVVEVLSPSTASKDRREKWALYQRSGVAEYLLIHPTDRYAEHFRLGDDGRYGEPTIWAAEDRLEIALIPDFAPTFHELFGWPPARPASLSPPTNRPAPPPPRR